MAGIRGIDEMEESWLDLTPAGAETPKERDSVLLTGQEAYLRTKQLLDEAATVSSMLFDDIQDMSGHFRKAYERDDALDASASAAVSGGWMPDATIGASGSFGGSFIPFPAGEVGSRVSGRFGGGVMAAAAGSGGSEGASERRPEEKMFCEAFLDLQSLVQRLPPGERVKPDELAPIVQKIDSIVWEAEQAAVNSTARLRELQGGGSDDVAEAAAAAHELSLEKDTWALLLKMSGDDHLNRAIEDEVRREPLRYSAPGPNASDQHVLDAMRHRDPEFRRTEAVVEWLQGAMKARLDELAPAEGIVRGGGLGWSHTLESLAVGGGQKSEVAQMHPDANLQKVSRSSGRVEMVGDALQVMRLVGQDDIDEEELMRTVWVLVRAGEMRRARVLCENRGQPWRAAAMAGGAVVGSRGENHGEEDGAVYSPGQALWQEMCWKLSASLHRGAENSEGAARSVAKHEAAVFAHLAGNAELLLASELTQSWEDQAWVRFSTLLQLKVLHERIRHREAQASLSSLFPGVGSLSADERLLELMRRSSPPTTHSTVFDVLDDTSRGRVRAEGRGLYRQAQQALIMGGADVHDYLHELAKSMTAGQGVGVGVGLEQGGEGGSGEGDGEAEEKTAAEMCRSPQLLRFAAHLALVLEAQRPSLALEDRTLDAIHDVVCAYVEHLARTQQVRLVAIYAATLPTRRRRDLYAGFLRSVEGEENRREALEQAEKHMGGDLAAILKKVVEDVRRHTPSVAPRAPMQVPEGDLKKIGAMSWLLDHPGARAEAMAQANTLARHLLLQTYQVSILGGRGWTGGEVGLSAWGDTPPLGFSGDEAGEDTPVVLSPRVEAVGMLLRAVSASRGEGDGDEAEEADVDADAAREQGCWALLLEARKAYLGWVSVSRARERAGDSRQPQQQQNDGQLAVPAAVGTSGEGAVDKAAEKAMEAMIRILTFEGGWMYPEDPTGDPAAAQIPTSTAPPSAESMETENSLAMRGGVDAAALVRAGGDAEAPMDVFFPLGDGGDGGGPDAEDRRRAKEVVEKRRARERREREEAATAEEAARLFAQTTRKEELLRVREACLPGLVFLAHEVAHGTGLWMFKWSDASEARGWFVRAQNLANVVVRDEYRTLMALSPAHKARLLQCVERSSTKVLECDERCLEN